MYSCAMAIPLNLTLQGHEFIENAKNDIIWLLPKQAVNKVGNVSFSVWAGGLTEVVKQNLGLRQLTISSKGLRRRRSP